MAGREAPGRTLWLWRGGATNKEGFTRGGLSEFEKTTIFIIFETIFLTPNVKPDILFDPARKKDMVRIVRTSLSRLDAIKDSQAARLY